MSETERKGTTLDIDSETERGFPTNSRILKAIKKFETLYAFNSVKIYHIESPGEKNYVLKKISLSPSKSDPSNLIRMVI